MTYSTCSLNPLENEAVVAQLLLRSQGAANPQSLLGDLLSTPEYPEGVGCVCGGGSGGVRMPVHSVACIGQAGTSVRLSCKSSHGAEQLCTALHCNRHAQLELCSTQRTHVIPHAAHLRHTTFSAHLATTCNGLAPLPGSLELLPTTDALPGFRTSPGISAWCVFIRIIRRSTADSDHSYRYSDYPYP